MHKNLTISASLGVVTILLGAFGAHALSKSLTIEGINSFETAVLYQMFHVIVLLFVNTYKGFSFKQQNRISVLFFLGILFFSGSIYVIQLAGVSAKTIWFITPLGGLFFILGWLVMAFSFSKRNQQ
ncbi:MAG: DUF423 domain-containing protein [Polaribacter sp.]|nr:DUF423 domain-containing protein [Polaribacter sp.]MDG1811002.1 DUF423 domain-containing protein [Polaribacter sp.]MDG1993957.1 DUF423 domain-containing protein [Polaribacter sp.]